MNTGEWLWDSLLLLPLLNYAEIHYRIPGIPSRLFKKEPEIIFDLPYRAQRGSQVPLFLFIKDAHLFPVQLLSLRIIITSLSDPVSHLIEIPLNQIIQNRFHSKTIPIPANQFKQTGTYHITAELEYQVKKKRYYLKQDNYRSISHEPFSIYISDYSLPTLPGCYWGDLHLHSNYTNDQIEFAAPIQETVLCAQTLGLDFLAITDHSYDLDDIPDDYSKNDPSLKKWNYFLEETSLIDQKYTNFIVLPGKEVSTGNYKNQNVHCLLLGNTTYYPGSGDSGERPLSNRPCLPLTQLFENVRADGNAIIAAAHPFEQPPFLHQIILNRGYWHKQDLSHSSLDYWQILNGKIDLYFQKGLQAWKKALLERQQIGILGGTDSHGNFNCSRSISIPFITLSKQYDQLLGQTRTGVFSDAGDIPLTQTTLLQKLHQKRVIISSGPAASLNIYQNGKNFKVGDHIEKNHPFILEINACSTPEFGVLQEIILFTGNYASGKERSQKLSIQANYYQYKHKLNISTGLPEGYLRLEVYTNKDHHSYFCLTNPIWIA